MLFEPINKVKKPVKYTQFRIMADKDHYLGYIYAHDINDAFMRAERLFYRGVYVEYADDLDD
jgi:hypothetical protein